MFQILSLLLLILAASFVLIPLWWRSRSRQLEDEELRREANIALFQERSDELEADLAEGRIDQSQYQALLLELQGSLLSDTEARDEQQGNKAKPSVSKSSAGGGRFRLTLILPLLMLAAIPIASFLLYERWGFLDDVQLVEEYRRTVENQGDPEVAQELIVTLGRAVRDDEDQPWAWYFLAENFASLSLFGEAEIAYRRAADLLTDTPEKALVLGRIALANYILSDFEITPEILAVVNEARAINPNETSVLQLLAADAEQNQNWQAAIEYWRLLIQNNPNSQQAQVYRQQVAAAQRLLGEGGEATGASIEVSLSLSDELEIEGSERVFIAVRNAEREGMPPLAAIDLSAADLPGRFVLNDSNAVGPFNLSSADTVYVSALLSLNNSATAQSGDYRVVSDNFSPNGQHAEIELTIAEPVP